MYARQTRMTADAGSVDESIEHIRGSVLPALQAADGFKGFTLLVDRESGDFVGTSYFETREALDASEDAVRGPREEAADVAHAEAPEVRVLEVVIDTED